LQGSVIVLYRCYFLDAENRIAEVATLDEADDQAALDAGRRLLANDPKFSQFSGIEVWQEARRVFPPPD
jgi:hypothetical protein